MLNKSSSISVQKSLIALRSSMTWRTPVGLISFHGGPAGVRGITRSRATGGGFGTGGMRGRSPSSTSDGRRPPRCATTLRRGPRLRRHSRRWAARNGGFGTTPGKKTVAKPFSQPSSAQVTGSKDLARACPSLVKPWEAAAQLRRLGASALRRAGGRRGPRRGRVGARGGAGGRSGPRGVWWRRLGQLEMLWW